MAGPAAPAASVSLPRRGLPDRIFRPAAGVGPIRQNAHGATRAVMIPVKPFVLRAAPSRDATLYGVP